MHTQLYAKVIEDNGGGLSLYVMNDNNCCIYAHSGYEYGPIGQLQADLNALAADDSVSDWEGNEEDMVDEWKDLAVDPIARRIVASLTDAVLHLYVQDMGAAAKRAFGIKNATSSLTNE